MKRIRNGSYLFAVALIFGLYGPALASSKAVEVVVTNYTTGQPFSPVACVVHDENFAIYELGQPASQALESIAEDAVVSDLQALVDAEDSAKMLVVGAGPIAPGGTDSVVVEMGRKDLVSCVWMLVNTNDTFSSITAVARPRKRQIFEFHRIALDAGTEVNDEIAGNIPGPCCGDEGRHGEEEEGVVLGSPGIAGGASLGHQHDWRGAVAGVVVRRQ